ncbi:PrpF protein [Russula earlei]|uniref:PrpF protein n=1 Tax=Russula earlei TaxID=71964 RepID=A0ACC0UE80_9AGAM|nr:PrpF protein [Russula earlei]
MTSLLYLTRTPFSVTSVLRHARHSSSLAGVANPLPASFLRGGTSKGIFLHRAHLPPDRSQWDAVFLGIMGSPDAQYGRQLNGMGGGVSSVSKICVVGPPSEAHKSAGIDVEYTFAQVGIRDSVVDYSGNCGNLSSMIGVFAVDEGMCLPRISQGAKTTGAVRTFNSNTNKRIDNTFLVAERGGRFVPVLDAEQTSIAGVPGRASPILLDFIAPSGARTGRLLPTGRPQDAVRVALSDSREATLPVSLVDATNPTVFTSDRGLRSALGIPDRVPIDYAEFGVVDALERVRQAGARLMGLDPLTQAQPKVAVLGPPSPDDVDADVVINAFSMGVLHRAVPMTVGLCLGVAACVPRTLASDAVRGRRDAGELLRIRHPGGVVEVGAEMDNQGAVRSARVIRTGRRLMKGVVWW